MIPPRVALLLAPVLLAPSGPSVLYELHGSAPGDRFGASLAAVGDVDGDDVVDVLVGAPGLGGVGLAAGGARLISGASGRSLLSLAGDHAYDRLGYAVCAAGDVDGDGVPDLAVASPTGQPAAGRVAVYGGLDGQLLWSAAGDAPGDRFGHALASLGDVDLDGVPDLLLGAPHADVGGTLSGQARALSGADGDTLWSLSGQAFDQLGLAVAGVGDQDADGLPDALLGAPFSDVLAFNGGSAWLRAGHDGSALDGWHGDHAGDLLGHGVAAAGDLDADGQPDLLVAAPGDDLGGLDAGRVLAFSGATGDALLQWTGEAPGTWLLVAAPLGDVDGDGHADVGLGATSAGPDEAGVVRVVSGADGQTLHVVEGDGAQGWFGHALVGPGDLDGDGLPDVVAGAPASDDVTDAVGSLRAFGCAPEQRGPSGARARADH